MPELPEVETVRRQLHERIAGKTIRDVELYKVGRERPEGKKFVSAVVGKRLLGVERRAKVLIFRFNDGSAMLGHLKMTGKFLFVHKKYSPTKHDRMLFVFTGDTRMIWSDVRMFGYLRFVNEQGAVEALSIYGPEPLETPAEALADRLKAPKTRKVKAALLDQTAIAGVGNIYADEACFRASIRPTRRLSTLTAADRLRLAQEIKNVLAESIAQKGTSANDYVDTDGEKGGFLNFLQVYGREEQPCRTCEKPIKKMALVGRGTHYCATCQK